MFPNTWFKHKYTKDKERIEIHEMSYKLSYFTLAWNCDLLADIQ